MSLRTANTWQRHLAFGGCLAQGKVTDWAIKNISNHLSLSSSGKDPLGNPIISLLCYATEVSRPDRANFWIFENLTFS